MVPGTQCDAAGCNLPLKADCIWNDVAHGQIHLLKICGFHLWALRHQARERGGGAVFMPLDTAPPLERVAAEMQRLAQARRPPPQAVYRPMQFINFGMGGTTTTVGGTYFRFG